MKKVYYLSTCSTCRRIIREVEPDSEFVFQDIKNETISKAHLDGIYKLSGSYSSIFNKQARKYREMGLHSQELGEERMRQLILEEYTFLKRPIFIIDNQIFIGNSRKVVNELSTFMQIHKRHSVSPN
ncbi:arsenate reductase family protein [Saccharicrinis sp. GN24d3]|uniref:arsenate reductase family protein n=1 Tax=Saccharicrinis sp. GN24d3 TaxID=3458416 RepID=UPI00403552E3